MHRILPFSQGNNQVNILDVWEACCGGRPLEDSGMCGRPVVGPEWMNLAWGGPVEEGACPGFAAAPRTGISCEFQESSTEMNLIFLQMRKGALREEKPGWALTFNFQAL